MVIQVVEFSYRGYELERFFSLKINIPYGKLLNFKNRCNGEVAKIGHHFRKKKQILKLILSKNADKKNCASKLIFFNELDNLNPYYHRDVTTGATGATKVAPKFSDTLTLSQPGWADYAHHQRGRT